MEKLASELEKNGGENNHEEEAQLSARSGDNQSLTQSKKRKKKRNREKKENKEKKQKEE